MSVLYVVHLGFDRPKGKICEIGNEAKEAESLASAISVAFVI